MLLDRDFADGTLATDDAAFAEASPGCLAFEHRLRGLPLVRRMVQARQVLIHSGQPLRALHFVHSGCFKVSIASPDGREKVTGFRMRGELLGLEALGTPQHASNVVALDVGEVWEIPLALLREPGNHADWLRDAVTAASAGEIRRDWQWMLSIGTLTAEQRVVAFLLDLAERQRALGYSAGQLVLRMTRAELGNFLSLQLETVTRALSSLAAGKYIDVSRRTIQILQLDALRQRMQPMPLAA